VNDNVRRGLRTGIQALLGVAASGGLAQVWSSYISHHPVDTTVQLAIGVLVLTPVAAWAQNVLEDQFGGGILVPKDRVAGDAALGEANALTRNMR
jgi:hypothetical protein